MKRLRFKKLPSSITVRLFAVVTFVTGLIFVSILTKDQVTNVAVEKIPTRVIEVKTPPVWSDDLSEQEIFWQFEKLLNPNLTIPNPIPEGIPHSCGHLYVVVENDGQIKINSQVSGNLENTGILKQELQTIFQDRTRDGVFAEGSNSILKSVIVKAPPSMKYGDFIKILNAVEESGADPIVLQTDQYPARVFRLKNL